MRAKFATIQFLETARYWRYLSENVVSLILNTKDRIVSTLLFFIVCVSFTSVIGDGGEPVGGGCVDIALF